MTKVSCGFQSEFILLLRREIFSGIVRVQRNEPDN